MGVFNKLRHKAFWLLDSLKGGRVKNDLEDIDHSLGLPSFKLLQEKNEKILNTLLDTVVVSTEFYAKYKGFENIYDFPVVNKSIIRANFESINIVSDNRQSSNRVSVSSSGSTGKPFMVYQTKRKKARNMADVIFFGNYAGYTLGNKILFIKLWVDRNKKAKAIARLQNIEPLDVLELSDPIISKFISKIKTSKSPKSWLGYPSGFEKICDYLDRIESPPLACNVKSIIATSESLNNTVKSKMEHYFQSPVVSRYSNMENGIIAQQLIGTEHYIINWASYGIEILDFSKDEAVKNGELGRIVITDLYNYATPMIRYDTGDIGSMATRDDHKFPVLATLQGRLKDVLYNTDGKIVNPFVIYNSLYDYPELHQVQLVQLSASQYVFKINCETAFKRETEFLSLFKKYLGQDALITAEYVNEIPLLKSGKRKIIINLSNGL